MERPETSVSPLFTEKRYCSVLMNHLKSEKSFSILIIFHSSCQSLGAEKDSLDMVKHEWAIPKFEPSAEVVLRKLVNWDFNCMELAAP